MTDQDGCAAARPGLLGAACLALGFRTRRAAEPADDRCTVARNVDELLFNSGYLRDALAQQGNRMLEEVKRAPEDHVLHVDVDAWSSALAERYRVEPPELAPERDWYQDELKPIQVDVSHDHFMRAIIDPTTPTYIDGYRVVVRIPFTGDPGIFKLQPSTYTLNPPRGTIRRQELTQTMEYPHDRPADIAAAARGLVNSLGTYLRSAQGDIEAFNQGLEAQARGAIENRRQRILVHREHVAATGLPTRKREDRNTTYVADAIVRRPAPPLDARPLDQPIRLEPVLAERVYEDVLGILRSACLSMERSPATYVGMGEEDRRQVLLIPLNTQYRGQASAEAFNVAGKTDMLLKWEGQNLFIAECKIWRGSRASPTPSTSCSATRPGATPSSRLSCSWARRTSPTSSSRRATRSSTTRSSRPRAPLTTNRSCAPRCVGPVTTVAVRSSTSSSSTSRPATDAPPRRNRASKTLIPPA